MKTKLIPRLYTEAEMAQFAFECVAGFLNNDNNKVEIKLIEIIMDRNNERFIKFKKKNP